MYGTDASYFDHLSLKTIDSNCSKINNLPCPAPIQLVVRTLLWILIYEIKLNKK